MCWMLVVVQAALRRAQMGVVLDDCEALKLFETSGVELDALAQDAYEVRERAMAWLSAAEAMAVDSSRLDGSVPDEISSRRIVLASFIPGSYDRSLKWTRPRWSTTWFRRSRDINRP